MSVSTKVYEALTRDTNDAPSTVAYQRRHANQVLWAQLHTFGERFGYDQVERIDQAIGVYFRTKPASPAQDSVTALGAEALADAISAFLRNAEQIRYCRVSTYLLGQLLDIANYNGDIRRIRAEQSGKSQAVKAKKAGMK